ncbi:MAG: hypothetical protein WCP18_01875 [bacterium]
MLGFKKKEQAQPATTVAPKLQGDVYVMPDKFHPYQKAETSNKALIITLAVFVLATLSTATYFFYDMWQKNANSPAVSVPVVVNNNSNTNINTNEPGGLIVNEQALGLVGDEVTTTIDTTSSTLALVATSTGNPPNLNLNQTTPPVISRDTDNDSLTDLEENLIGANPVKPDSDSDSYLDGSEVASLYDPLKSGTAKLKDADFIQILVTDFSQDNFQIFVPKKWQATTVESSRQVLITTETGEVIRISVKENSGKSPVSNWYLASNPGADVSQLKNIDFGVYKGVSSPTGLEIYLSGSDPSKIYSFEYLLEKGSEFRYPHLFMMIAKSFQTSAGVARTPAPTVVTPPPATIPPASNATPSSGSSLSPSGLPPSGSSASTTNP